jgi:hypothetical protein
MASPFIPIIDTSSAVDGSKNWDIATNPGRTHRQSPFRTRERKPMESLPQSPNPIPEYRAQLLSNFICLYLPKNNHHAPIIGRTPSSWVFLLARSTFHSSAYNISLATLCAAQLGTWNRDEVMLNESVRLYASSLRELRANVVNASIEKGFEPILASIVILSIYEVR